MEDVKTELYPEIEPYITGMLSVSSLHTVYYEESGNKHGKPVIFLHGGPGAGTSGLSRRYFDPDVYRIVLLDQRGSGKSTPPGETKENTTWDLVEDIEKLRQHLHIAKWHLVIGGSWGSTLSLTYSQTHPDRVGHIIIMGIWTMRRKELLWIFQDGASRVHPELYENVYLAPIPQVERHDLMSAYNRFLNGDDEDKMLECARAWATWEIGVMRLIPADDSKMLGNDEWVKKFSKIECHYCVHGGFFKSDSHLLDNVDKIRHIPAIILQGRYDMCCPVDTAWQLHKRWPEASFKVVHGGHTSFEEPLRSELLKACEQFKGEPWLS